MLHNNSMISSETQIGASGSLADNPHGLGGVFNFFSEFPHWMSAEEIGVAKLELDTKVQAFQQPPVAKVSSAFDYQQGIDVADYRMFYVEFEPDASLNDVYSALDIVANAIASLRR